MTLSRRTRFAILALILPAFAVATAGIAQASQPSSTHKHSSSHHSHGHASNHKSHKSATAS